MSGARIALTAQDIEKQALHSLGAAVVLYRDPGLGRRLHGRAEGLPGGHQAVIQALRAPIAIALLDLGRGEKHHRAWAWQLSCAAKVAHVAGPHGTAIGQMGEMLVNALAQRHAASKVDINARGFGGDLRQNGVGARPEVRGADEEVEGAVEGRIPSSR